MIAESTVWRAAAPGVDGIMSGSGNDAFVAGKAASALSGGGSDQYFLVHR